MNSFIELLLDLLLLWRRDVKKVVSSGMGDPVHGQTDTRTNHLCYVHGRHESV